MKYLEHFVLLLITCGSALCDPGRSFIIALPHTRETKSILSYLRVMAPSSASGSTRVWVTSPSSAPVVLNDTYVVLPGQDVRVDLTDELLSLPPESLISNMTINVTADADVSVTIKNARSSNGDAFSPMPTESLATEYYTLAGVVINSYTASFIVVSAPYDDTEVTLTFPADHNLDVPVQLQGVTYVSDDIISVSLNGMQSLQLLTGTDLTGVKVTSSRPVSVLTGQNRTQYVTDACKSHVLAQMPPTSHWAKLFVLTHLPESLSMTGYQFVAKEPMTTVTVVSGSVAQPNNTVLKLQFPGDAVVFNMTGGQLGFASADKPVLVGQYILGATVASSTDPDPALSVIPGLEHGMDVFYFGFDVEFIDRVWLVITVRSQYTNSLTINGQSLSSRGVQWRQVPGASEYVVGHLSLAPGDVPCTLEEPGGGQFIVHLFEYVHCDVSSMAFTHGQPQVQSQYSCPVTPHRAGDLLDNDCDADVDEEPCCINTQPSDTDGDTYRNEDCAGENVCCTEGGLTYPCAVLARTSKFKMEPNSRRLAETIRAIKATTRISCGHACLLTEGCWGINFDREGHTCEVLSGRGKGVVASDVWGFMFMTSEVSYSSPAP